MTVEEYEERMNQLVMDLPEMHANLLVGVANTAAVLIKQRIQTTGTDANGNKFKSYSDWYQKYKTAKGKNKGFTDFSFTNRMWTNIQLIQEKSSDTIAVITAKDKGSAGSNIQVTVKGHERKGKPIKSFSKNVYVPSNYEKLEKNTKKFGEILMLSKTEIEDLKSDYDNGILDIFRAHGL
jgi:hypothetical protein